MKCNNNIQLAQMVGWTRNQYPTGSRVIGGWNNESDYDFVALEEDVRYFADSIGLDISLCNLKRYHLNFMSLKYRNDASDNWTNLIIVPDNMALESYKYATERLQQAPASMVKHKPTRCLIFEALQAEFFALNDITRLDDFHSAVKERWTITGDVGCFLHEDL